MNQITTHVLDTSKGKHADGLKISLQKPTGNDMWEDICTGTTNNDGRIPGFMDDISIEPGVYRMLFDTKSYFDKQGIHGFYPYAPIVFEITDTEHYHIPLLLNPFGYSTYRGS